MNCSIHKNIPLIFTTDMIYCPICRQKSRQKLLEDLK